MSFFIIDSETFEIKSDYIFKQIKSFENNLLFKQFIEKIIKINNNPKQNYQYKIIYFSEFIILVLVNFDVNNNFICIFNNNKNIKNSYYKLFLLHIAISYRNTFNKLSKFLPSNKNLFPLIFTQIFFLPFLHNFEKIFSIIVKKIDLVLFGNSEYISSLMFDLENKYIIYDTGYLVQKNYKSNILDFSKKNKIIDELYFFGQKLKNNYFKSGDKHLDKIDNYIKLELRATFPKPLFIIKFYPLLKGVLLIHVFHQYKLSKIQVLNPQSNSQYTFEKYKEIDAVFFDFYNKLEELNSKEIIILEKFFFEYFFILGNNIKEIGRNFGNFNKNLMTYKSREFDLIYLNKQILQIIKDCFGQFYLNNKENIDENNLIYKIKKRFGAEYEKYKNEDINSNINNTNILLEEGLQSKSEKININNNINDNLNINENTNNNIFNLNKIKNLLEFSFFDFIKEFDLRKIIPKNNNINLNEDENNIINTNDINIQFQESSSNINEYSKLNLSKDNIELIKRTIIPSATRTHLISKTNSKTNTYSNTNLPYNEFNTNTYDNYGLFSKETRNMKTEEDKEIFPLNTKEPFKIDITSITNNIEVSKEESEFKSILTEKENK